MNASNDPRVISRDWVQLSFDHTVYNTDEFQAWMKDKWNKGEKIYSWPVMDGTEYGMHQMYKFEDPQLAEVCKLSFTTIDGNR